MEDEQATTPEERLSRVIDAVIDRYGRREKVHRLAMERSLRCGDRRVLLLVKEVIAGKVEGGVSGAGLTSHATAFVANHAVAGVLRA